MLHLIIEDFAGRRRLEELRASLGDPSTASLNTTSFEGARLELSELAAACEAMPFLAPRRLVIVRGLMARPAPEGGEDQPAAPTRRGARALDQPLLDYLERVPETTELVLLESQPPPSGALLRAIEKMAGEGRAEIVRDRPLDENSAADWARTRASEMGGRLAVDGALALVAAVGPDRTSLERELEKLVLYAEGREVGEADVAALVSAGIGNRVIFELVDAIGSRNARGAVRAWRTLVRSGDDQHRMLAMVGRQFRLLVQASELSASGAPPPRVAQVLAVPPRVASGLQAQARRWPPGGLEKVLARLVVLDRESKTGGPDLEPALEGLIAELVASR